MENKLLDEEQNILYFDILKKNKHRLFEAFSDLDRYYQEPEDWEQIQSIMAQVTERMTENYPYFHPSYAGQMIKPPHPIAMLAYQLSMWINPNNHALDGGIASSKMEKEIIRSFKKYFGWKSGIGHLTGGGTMANLEALWLSGKINPDKYIIGSDACHYTHDRICSVLKLNYKTIPTDQRFRIDLNIVEELAKKNKIATLIANMGSTGTGSVDPLEELIHLKQKYGFRIHADAAYGGYFKLVSNLDVQTKTNFQHLAQVDSIVIDPHKHGLQPYGCGCILIKDEQLGKYYKHDSPYTYFSSDQLHLGEISLECSRPGAAAVALWATMQLLPLIPNGKFSNMLSKSRSAALYLYKLIEQSDQFENILSPELDIINFTCTEKSIRWMSEKNISLFNTLALKNIHLALNSIHINKLDNALRNNTIQDNDQLTVIRMCLLKPTHLDFVDKIWAKINTF